jgi:hypothetical protein
MTQIAWIKPERMLMSKLSKGANLLDELTALWRREQVRSGLHLMVWSVLQVRSQKSLPLLSKRGWAKGR